LVYADISSGDWVKKCIEYPRLGGPSRNDGPKMTWSEVVNKDMKELTYEKRTCWIQ